MKTEVTLSGGDPAPDMTREETVTWLLGSTGTMGLGSALAATWLVTSVVDALKEGHPLEVDTPGGLYSLTVTVSGRWWHRVRTYHAEEI